MTCSRSHDVSRALFLSLAALSVGCAAGDDGAGGAGGAAPSVCAEGEIVCEGEVARTCDGKGGYTDDVDCADRACAPGVGCVACAAEQQSCDSGVGKACGADGRFHEFDCDPDQGMTCEADGCKGPCSPAVLGPSYLGCEYWPTVTMNGVFEDAFSFSVALGSTSPDVTAVKIEGPDFAFETELLPYEVKTLDLPWVQPLKGKSFTVGDDGYLKSVLPTENTTGKAYHIRTDRPVAVYQQNPREYENVAPPPSCPTAQFGGCFSFSNDASLLLPENALTGNYVVAGHRTVFTGDLVAITATRDGTEVLLRAGPRARSLPGAGVDLFPGDEITLSMNQGDVLQLFTKGTSAAQSWSGTQITASAPIQVISGSPCATIPDSVVACDHLEETVLPLETLGRRYAVTVPRTPLGLGGTPHGGRHVVRIHGLHDGTALVFDPPGITPETMIDRGDALELSGVEEDFVVEGSAAFAVTHYMIGEGEPGNPADGGAGAGDPSQSIAIPTEQLRKDYTFVTPVTFDVAFVNVVSTMGVPVEVDGAILTAGDFDPIGDSGMGVARLALKPQPSHRATSAEPFGVVVYGYGKYASYMYPGGLDLAKIEEPVPE